jgi:flagellar motility protein MotE (MotC chaperone)
MDILTALSRIRILPVTIAAAALAFGVHAGEAVQKLRPATSVAPKKITPVSAPNRTEIELAAEIAAKSGGADDSKRQMDLRARLLESSEQRIDAKLAQLKAAETQAAANSAGGRTGSAQFASLVKVYEVMKPKDAARIFEKLDMPVQLAVATAMKERSMAALMAEMSPEAARKLTMEMAAQAQLSGAVLRQSHGYVAR